MNRVVDQVAGERVDGEGHTVASPTRTLPDLTGHGVERVGELVGRGHELRRNGLRIGLVVALLDCRRILIPVREQRIVVVEHEVQPVVVQSEHVAYVTPVLERGPLVRPRTRGRPQASGRGHNQVSASPHTQ